MIALEQRRIVVPDRLVGVGKPVDIAIPEIRNILGDEKLPSLQEYMWCRPRHYRLPDDPHHGLQHTGETTAVALLHARLAKAFGYNVNWYVAGMAAGYHDIEHSGKEPDKIHGDLAATWFENNMIGDLVPEIVEIIRLHVPEDAKGKGLSDNAKVVKDADSINRIRFWNEKYGLDVEYLRFDYATELLVQPAVLLHHRTNELMEKGFGDGHVCAGQAMVDIGLLFAK